MKISQCFNIKKGDIITVTGGGGKTSLIFSLAEELMKESKVLITTTTKIYEPESFQYKELILVGDGKLIEAERKKGSGKNIFILGERLEPLNKKLIGINDYILEECLGEYDYILIEGDGSNSKPLKYWNEHDPIISKFSTKVIGVSNLDALGKEVSEVSHRVEKLCEKHKWSEEKIINSEDFAEYLIRGDFFKKSQKIDGVEKFFFINGVEGIEKLNLALEVGNLLMEKGREEKIILGSFRDKEFYSYKKVVAILLASGFSKRFGGDKLLFEYENKSLLDRSLDNINNINFLKKNVIIREDKKNLKSIEKLDKNSKWKILINNEAHLGQSSGVKLGVNTLSCDESVMFFTGDQPFLNKETILEIIKSYLKEMEITIPYVGEESFAPVIFSEKYKNRLENVQGDKGGKSILKESDPINKVFFKEKKIFFDIDTKEDLESINNK